MFTEKLNCEHCDDNNSSKVKSSMEKSVRRRALIIPTILASCILAILALTSNSSSFVLVQNESLITQAYKSDVTVGEQILEKMSGKVHSKVWNQMIGQKSIRQILAAALGADAYLSRDGAKSLEADVDALFPSVHEKREGHSLVQTSSLTQKSLVPSRGVFNAKNQVKSPGFHFAYDAFAPGVLPARVPKQPHRVLVEASTSVLASALPNVDRESFHSKKLDEIRKGFLKASGFADTFATLDTPTAHLQREVHRLKAKLKEEEAELRHTHRNNRLPSHAKSSHSSFSGSTPKNSHSSSPPSSTFQTPKAKGTHAKSTGEPTLKALTTTTNSKTTIQNSANSNDSAPAAMSPDSLNPHSDTERMLNDLLRESHLINAEAHATRPIFTTAMQPPPPPASLKPVQRSPTVATDLKGSLLPSVARMQPARQTAGLAKSSSKTAPMAAATQIPILTRAKSRPLLCALPLLAEEAGIDCHQGTDGSRGGGQKTVKIPLLPAAAASPHAGGLAGRHSASVISLYHLLQADPTAVPVSAAAASAARRFEAQEASGALGFSDLNQFQRHRLISRLANDEAKLRAFRQKAAAAVGDIVSHSR